ncbi:transmembrane protease serine 5 [Pelecanus crispus]|uniref:transmembrane protease serine 5 n=1 Tax=Pelecanus crispus TaxID=36300 RepID=UPI003F5D3A2E
MGYSQPEEQPAQPRPALAKQFPDNLPCVDDAVQSCNSPTAEPRREARRTQVSPEHDSANASLKTLCTVRRLLLLLGVAGLLVGTAAGTWLLVKHLKKPQPDQGFTPLQEPDAMPGCSDGEEEDPVVRGAPNVHDPPLCWPCTKHCKEGNLQVVFSGMALVSFRINVANSLLEAQVEGHPGWLLVCHERWSRSLGTLLCRHLGYLRVTHQKGVNLTDVEVNDTQEFVQVRPRQEGSLEDMWQVRSSCESGQTVALKCSECGLRPGAARVVGGADVPPGRWPWQVSLYHGARHRCGGSVLAREWIVTVAHCVHRRLQASAWLVFAGAITHGSIEQEAGVSVKKIIYHPLYNDSSLDYDIALMKLQVPLNFSDAIRAVCLPPFHRDLFQGTQCWVSGWGYTRPDQAQVSETLKEAPVPLIGTMRCNSSCMYAGELTARMLCAGYLHGKIDACQGDSGSPLVCQDEFTWRLVGIVSWGRGCAEPNHPGVYTNVAQLLPWIYRITELKPETEGSPQHLPRLCSADPAEGPISSAMT